MSGCNLTAAVGWKRRLRLASIGQGTEHDVVTACRRACPTLEILAAAVSIMVTLLRGSLPNVRDWIPGTSWLCLPVYQPVTHGGKSVIGVECSMFGRRKG